MIRYMLGLTRGFRGRILTSALSGVLRVISGLVFVVLCKRAVDIATGNISGSICTCVVGILVAIVSELICSAVGNRSVELSEAELKNTLQRRLFSRLLMTPWTGKEKYHTGDSLSRLTDDCRIASECLCRTIPMVIIAVTQLMAAFLFMWYFSPLLAIILLSSLPVFILAGKLLSRLMRKLTQQIRGVEGRLQGEIQESLQHRILLLAYRQTGHVIDVLSALHASRFNLIRRRADLTMYSRTAVFAGFELGYLAAFLWGIRGLSMRTITFGTMTAYLQLAGQIQRPLAELSRLLPGIIQSHTAFSRIAEIEGLPEEDEAGGGIPWPCKTVGHEETALPLSMREGVSPSPLGLSFDNVSFRYPDGRRIFYHFSHTFLPGSKTAIMGETGVGKSTLLLLALAIIRPQKGDIGVFRISEREKVTVSPETRSLFVYVPQGNSLLSGTIRRNLLLGRPDATDEEMRRALHDAAADFVFDLKDGLDTLCGEHGYGLSEGQAQRIAIARALLHPGSILLLDEISASLDGSTEEVLLRRLCSGRVSHTIIFVTHRPAALSFCDSVLTIA